MKRKILSIALIIIGAILIATPLVGQEIVKLKQKQLYDEYMIQVEKQLSQRAEQLNQGNNQNPGQSTGATPVEGEELPINIMDDNFNSNIGNDDLEEKKEEESIWSKLTVIGRLIIPKIDVSLLILEGASDTELIYGAGHILETAYPGEVGNCSIAAHRGFSFGTYLYRANELEPGDKITVSYYGVDYTYILEETFLVLPTDTYVLRQPKDKKILTLVTCDPPITGTHRMILRARLEGDVDIPQVINPGTTENPGGTTDNTGGTTDNTGGTTENTGGTGTGN